MRKSTANLLAESFRFLDLGNDLNLSGKAVPLEGVVVVQCYDKATVATGLLAKPLEEAQEFGRRDHDALLAQVGATHVRANVAGRHEGQAHADHLIFCLSWLLIL